MEADRTRLSVSLLSPFVFWGLLVVSTLFLHAFPAYASQNNYFSIHIASFKELKRANSFINSLSEKGKLVFWKQTDIPGKGMFYRVYLGKYNDKDKAEEFWQVLKEEGAVSYYGIHEFEEEIQPPDEEEPQPTTFEREIKPRSEIEGKTETPAPAISKDRFVDNGDGTITDSKLNLMWIKNGWRIDFFSALKWDEALEKCGSFRYGGYSDWRLPTINEWQSLVDKKNQYPALIEPNPFENIIVHMPYWSKTEYSPKQMTLTQITRAYTILLYYGRIGHQNVNKRAFVMPVRSLN
jgi:hypothetical protein